eukprot:TRINITY_DN16966_c0_g1_i1.p1 TRINITY_DN16966_c0_g1~~TRINITY_DN16966_c0_g1_i1.p1  ORF type:complete len:323 (-),score=49.17 TRINITY_DN16966_c0_g1_i1:137-1105(-)
MKALNLRTEEAQAVSAIFDAVGKNESNVMSEFDLHREAQALRTAATLCTQEWNAAYCAWHQAMLPVFMAAAREGQSQASASLPPHVAILAAVALQQSQAWCTRVPEPVVGHTSVSALAMTRAGGESIHALLESSGSFGSPEQQEAAMVLVGYAVPFIGWLLLCKSSSHLAHVDPHPGNFRWDAVGKTLWVLDWGSHVMLADAQRRSLCMLISLLANDGDDELVADMARTFGVSCESNERLAKLMKDILNVSSDVAAQEAIEHAAVDSVLQNVSSEVVPVIRCLTILGGMLKTAQRRIRDTHQHDVPLSLASLWAPFAARGLQ